MHTSVNKTSTELESQRAKQDPKVSCPIFCGGYMRATGFFYRSETDLYLVTARHNVLPTNIELTLEGKCVYSIENRAYLPEIRVSLREESSWTEYNIDLRRIDNEKIINPSGTDILAVSINFDPTESGYYVWNEADVGHAPDDADVLETIGFDGHSFPSTKENWPDSLGLPRTVGMQNVTPKDRPRYSSRMGMGLALEGIGEYDGLSGSPVIGESLVGIHVADVPKELSQNGEITSHHGIQFFSAQQLTKHL